MLHLLTVKTYMKKRDLKLELQLTEIDKREEGEIAEGEDGEKETVTLSNSFCGL